MALDYQDLYQQVKQAGETALGFFQQVQGNRQKAVDLFRLQAQQSEALRAKVQRAARLVPSLRCALPISEALDGHFAAAHTSDGALLLAADGSQIPPDRHAQVNYYLVNVGVMQMLLGSTSAPQVFTRSELFYGDELFNPQGVISAEAVALKRDLKERQALLEFCRQARLTHTQIPYPPIVTLTDGTLELWGTKEREDGGGSFRKALQDHLESLKQLCALDVISAAYVDKPRANLVVRLLEVAALPEDRLDQAGKVNAFQGVSDDDLYGAVLAAGERSPVFGIQSQSINDYQEELALHFFYLNVGNAAAPWLARVEIPAWVAQDPRQVSLLQAVLVQQCRILGANPYPYLLHRAHEAAVVNLQEKEQLTQMLVQEFLRRGVPVGQESHKQSLKSQPGRTRMK